MAGRIVKRRELREQAELPGPAAAEDGTAALPAKKPRAKAPAAFRVRKLPERSGVTKELRKRRHYEKPCEERRRLQLRWNSAIRKAQAQARNGSRR